MKYNFLQCGDSALTINFGSEINSDTTVKVTALSKSLGDKPIKGVVDIIPAYTSVTVCFDPCTLSLPGLIKKLNNRIKSQKAAAAQGKKVFLIPVCYDEDLGEDMSDVMAHSGLSRQQVIDAHSGRDYLIYMLGFLPGFAYLGGMDSRLDTPRLDTPRGIIPGGSVGIGGSQTGIYPVASPGGWRLIGRTPVKVFDKSKSNPVLYSTGDYIRFCPIDRGEYDRILTCDDYKVEVEYHDL